MGLGVALTGFLTGFAERATDLIDERNKELRKEHQQKLDLHAATVAEEMKARKEQRAEYRSRLETLKSYGMGSTINSGLLGAIVTDDIKYNNLIKEAEKLKTADLNNLIKDSFKFASPNSLKYDNPKQYIDAVLGERAPISPTPLPTQTTTAFGLSSPIQKRMSEEYDRSLKIAGYDPSKTTTVPTGSITGGLPITADLTETETRRRFDRGIISELEVAGVFKDKNTRKNFVITPAKTPDQSRIVTGENDKAKDTINFAKLEYVKKSLKTTRPTKTQLSFFAEELQTAFPSIAEQLINPNVSSSSVIDSINELQPRINSGYINKGAAANQPKIISVGKAINLMKDIKDKDTALYATNKKDIDNFISTITPITTFVAERYDDGKSNISRYSNSEKLELDKLLNRFGFSNFSEYTILYKQFVEAGLI